jgi:hypothetical protein
LIGFALVIEDVYNNRSIDRRCLIYSIRNGISYLVRETN